MCSTLPTARLGGGHSAQPCPWTPGDLELLGKGCTEGTVPALDIPQSCSFFSISISHDNNWDILIPKGILFTWNSNETGRPALHLAELEGRQDGAVQAGFLEEACLSWAGMWLEKGQASRRGPAGPKSWPWAARAGCEGCEPGPAGAGGHGRSPGPMGPEMGSG